MEKNSMKNIALISLNLNPYSKTFVQAHKNYFDAHVFYYYDEITQLENEGSISLPRWRRVIQKIKQFLRISQLSVWEVSVINSFKKHRIDKVYAEFGPMGVLVMPICKKMNIPLIVNFHGYDMSVKQVLIDYERAYKELFEFAERIIIVSKLMRDKVIDLGANPEKTVYTPCAPDDGFFDINPTFTENAFVAVGRFVDKKAPYYTILAFHRVLDKFPDTKLYICGDGLLYNMCVNLVSYLNISDRVIFLGGIKPDALKELYGRVSGFVQHSITALDGDMEGTPVAVMEASAAGLPVVATKHAGIVDVIQDGITGLLVDEHDVESMANAMIYLLENKEHARKIGEAGRVFIKSNFSMSHHIGILNEILYS